MRGHEIWQGLQALLKQGLPGVDLRDSYAPQGATRLPARPVLSGCVSWDREEAGGWAARLALTLYLPPKETPAQGEDLLARAAGIAQEGFQTLTAAEQRAFAPDKATGLLAGVLLLDFAGAHQAGPVQVVIAGQERAIGGWSLKVAIEGRALTAMGEGAPFWVSETPVYTVQLEGLDVAGLQGLSGFSLEVAGRRFSRCRWKTLDSAKRQATALSYEMEGGDA